VDAWETSPANAERAKAFIRKKLGAGNGSVPLFDCGGLVMRYLQNIKAYFAVDKNAEGLLEACRETGRKALVPGNLLFRHNGAKAYHVGVYLENNLVIEAQGRDAGVVVHPLTASGEGYWNRYGILPCLEETRAARAVFAMCAGASVNVRKGPGTEHAAICVAHQGDSMIAIASEQPEWDQVALGTERGLVTGYMYNQYIKYTEGGIER
jgi:uncharacterized protein YgiM (DUF1202 family)